MSVRQHPPYSEQVEEPTEMEKWQDWAYRMAASHVFRHELLHFNTRRPMVCVCLEAAEIVAEYERLHPEEPRMLRRQANGYLG